MTISQAEPARGTPVTVRGLTVRVGGLTLLEHTDARFEPGQITLIVGPSGAGKSTLLRILAGLHDTSESAFHVTGSVVFGDGNTHASRVSVGVVFQQFALFDELSPIDNVRFARAHRPPPDGAAPDAPRPEALLAELQVPRGVPTGALSGGQQQRLALARTLAYDPAVILYDEPTSGLDVATSESVAGLIRRTQDAHPRTSVVVTHDFETLAPIADRIYLLDPVRKVLREIDREHWCDLGKMLRSLAEEEKAGGGLERRAPPRSPPVKVAGAVGNFFAGTTQVLEQVLALPLRLLPLWRSPFWGLRFCLHYLRLVAGPLAMLYVAIAGVVVGFVTTYFTFRFLPYRQLTEPLIIENVLEAIGFCLYRVLVPVLITLLVAARCGAAVTSDVGGKVYGRQIDALRTLGVKPRRYLLTGILYSFLLGTPLLVFLAFGVAWLTSQAVFTAIHRELGPAYWRVHFANALLDNGRRQVYMGTGWLVAKVLSCAGGMALLAYMVGMRPKRSARDVSAGITFNILLSTVYVLLVHMVFALAEFD
jgi:ABC-type multidrug transport system ATPase subunit/ABC-type transporter Mla maintaining outer membrane lipid asymmetry permease subunit MlaE